MSWGIYGMRDEYQIIEQNGEFCVLHVLGQIGETQRQYYVTDGAGHLVCSQDRAIVEWFCEVAVNEGEEEAQAQFRSSHVTKQLPDTSDQE